MTKVDPLEPIVARLRDDERDGEAWASLYRLLWGYVLGITYRHVRGDRAAAEDLAQETFMRLARSRPFQKLQTAEAFRAYVWKTAENECRRRLARKQEPVDVEDLSTRADPVAEDPSEAVELRDLYDRISDDLEPVDRDILRLTDAGHSTRQIARLLGLTESNVNVRRHRARQKVRKYLENNGLLY